MMVRRSVWFLVFLLVTAACLNEPDCYNLNNNIIGIDFKKLEDSSRDTVVLTALGTLEPPVLFTAPGDTSLTRVNLPLNYFADETTFFFQNGETVKLLRLTYVSQAQFVSENCGEKFVLSTLRVADHSFDSVRLVRDIPTSSGGAIHIEIFQ